MARRRMFSLDVIDTDMFLDMPSSSQNLYFHLAMRADDDGFVSSPKKIVKTINSSDDDMRILLSKGLVIPFDSGVCVITHWKMHNYIQSDRYKVTQYVTEKNMLTDQNGVYSLQDNGLFFVSKPDTQVRLGKVRLGKVREERTASATQTLPAKVDPLYHPIEQAFLSKGNFANYKKEGACIKAIIAKVRNLTPDEAETTAQRIMETFHKLTRSNDRFYSSTPFLPSGLSPLVERVWAVAQKQNAEPSTAWVDEIRRGM